MADFENNTQLVQNSLDDAKTALPIKVVKEAQCGIQGNEITPFYLPLSECGETYASDNSEIPCYLSFEIVENSLDIDQYKSANSDIEPIISEDDIKCKSETLSKPLPDNISTVKTVSTINKAANCEIKLSEDSDYDKKCKTEIIFKVIFDNKKNICKNLTLGFLLSVVCCLIYYFASESFEKVNKSTTAQKTSSQFKYLDRKSVITANSNLPSTKNNILKSILFSKSMLSPSRAFNTMTKTTVAIPEVTENKNDSVQYNRILSNTLSASTKLTMAANPSKFKVTQSLYVTNGDHGGRWNSYTYCQPGTHAYGFSLKVEKDGGTFYDDAGLTNMQLYCKNSEFSTKSFVKSSIRDHNTNSYWRADKFCTENYYLVAFQLCVDPRQWFKSDQTAVTNINFVCRGPGFNGLDSYNIPGNGMMHYGDWGTFSEYCEFGTAICGMEIKAQPVPVMDKLGMTDLKLLCCQNL